MKNKLSNLDTLVAYKISASRFVLLLAIVNTAIFNIVAFEYLYSELELLTSSGFFTFLSVLVIIFTINLFFISLVTLLSPWLSKFLFIVTSFVNSIAFYYISTYGVILDKSMMGNIFNTRSEEALELLTLAPLPYILLMSILPSFIILKVKVNPINRLRLFFGSTFTIALCLLFLYLNSASWLWIDKRTKVIGGKILPWSYIFNSISYHDSISKKDKKQISLGEGRLENNGKTVVVLIIGEAARASNFSLYRYDRNTNPMLQSQDILVFDKTVSCSTYTTASVACILSYDIRKKGYEPLPSFLTRVGVHTVWRANNWGEPNIKVDNYKKGSELSKICKGDNCSHDGVLVQDLQNLVNSSADKSLFVTIHTKGSHGPSYYSRYPSKYEKFTPVCLDEDISKCTKQELINAYDNTILYTDFLINLAIEQLKKTDRPAMLLYISDHGESLGESGLYLHGAPMLIAPKYQKEVPFFIWRSKQLIEIQGLENDKINTKGVFGHQNIFHTVIGAFGIKADAYNRQLDLFSK